MLTAAELWTQSRAELQQVLQDGHPIDPQALDDTTYRGVSLGLGRVIERLTWKTFEKVFHRDPETGQLRGWNTRLEQTGLDGPVRHRHRRGRPWTFGHYRVCAISTVSPPRPCGPGLIVDYSDAGNRRWDPIGCLRDPIVAVNAGQHNLLLGWSYLRIGAWRIGTPSFFTLELQGPLSESVDPPRP